MSRKKSPSLSAAGAKTRESASCAHHFEPPSNEQGRTVYLLRLQSPHGDDIHRLRLLLKLLLRRYQLRCISVEQVQP
jgi:hypothetical protein